MDRLRWQSGQTITVSYVNEPGLLVVLFRLTEPGGQGFKLSILNHTPSGGSGGKLTCKHLTSRIIRPCVPLPMRDLDPIYLSQSLNKPYQLALLVLPPQWLETEFSASGAPHIGTRPMGIYQ